MVIEGVPDVMDGLEVNDFLEEIECRVAVVCIREGGNTRSTGPGDDRGQEYADEDCAFDVIHYEKDRQDTGYGA